MDHAIHHYVRYACHVMMKRGSINADPVVVLLHAGASDAELMSALTAVRGIGPWTVDMFSMFHLGRPDVLPVGDLAVRKVRQPAAHQCTVLHSSMWDELAMSLLARTIAPPCAAAVLTSACGCADNLRTACKILHQYHGQRYHG
jgi:hypothetical protein